VDHAVADTVRAQHAVLADAGAVVTEAHPDLAEADHVFRTLRAWYFEARFGARLRKNPDAFKPSLADNIRAGEGLSGHDVAKAMEARTELFERVRLFFEDHDVLVMPVSQVPPFSADEEFPADINGQVQKTYLDWMRSAYFVTVTGCPAISVPAGFTPQGWPVGIQIVVPHNQERRLLEVAHAFEQANPAGSRRPTFSQEHA
jgi:amidase